MVNSTTQSSAVKVYPAIELTGKWVSPDPRGLLLSGMSAGLTITVVGKQPDYYWVSAHIHQGKVLGWRITKELPSGEFGESHDVPASLTVGMCSCPDSMVRQRPGGCRHTATLRKALKAIGLWEEPVSEAGAA